MLDPHSRPPRPKRQASNNGSSNNGLLNSLTPYPNGRQATADQVVLLDGSDHDSTRCVHLLLWPHDCSRQLWSPTPKPCITRRRPTKPSTITKPHTVRSTHARMSRLTSGHWSQANSNNPARRCLRIPCRPLPTRATTRGQRPLPLLSPCTRRHCRSLTQTCRISRLEPQNRSSGFGVGQRPHLQLQVRMAI
jgi:hypothetical protein